MIPAGETAAGHKRGRTMGDGFRQRIAERLAAWSARLLTWSNDIALRDHKRTRQQGV